MVRSQLYVSWASQTTRAANIASLIGVHNIQIQPRFRHRRLKYANYVISGIMYSWLLLSRRPRCLILSAPPTFSIYMTAVYKLLTRAFVVADCHNGVLSRPWVAMPGLRGALQCCDEVWFHNKIAARKACRLLKLERHVHVLVDPIVSGVSCCPGPHAYAATDSIVVPCSFSSDEPMTVLWQCAAQNPQWKFVVTGNYLRSRVSLESLPENVTLTGYINSSSYFEILRTAAVVLCLTTKRDVQLCSAAEAISLEKEVVCSDWRLLREQYAGLAQFSKNEPRALADAISACKERREADHADRMRGCIEAYQTDWWTAFRRSRLSNHLEGAASVRPSNL